MHLDRFFPLIFLALGVLYFIFRATKFGGFRGAFYGARVRKTLGEVTLKQRGALKTTVRVHELEADPDGHEVGLEFYQRSFGGFSARYFTLTRGEASELSKMLDQAERD